jgi:hypothetical protein
MNGKGIAIAGIWLGVAIASFSPAATGLGIITLAACAAIATVFTALLF